MPKKTCDIPLGTILEYKRKAPMKTTGKTVDGGKAVNVNIDRGDRLMDGLDGKVALAKMKENKYTGKQYFIDTSNFGCGPGYFYRDDKMIHSLPIKIVAPSTTPASCDVKWLQDGLLKFRDFVKYKDYATRWQRDEAIEMAKAFEKAYKSSSCGKIFLVDNWIARVTKGLA